MMMQFRLCLFFTTHSMQMGPYKEKRKSVTPTPLVLGEETIENVLVQKYKDNGNVLK